jgi:hypothetical protein
LPTGLTNCQIGAEPYLAEETVKNHVSSLLHKLGFSRRARCASVVVRGPVAGDADVTMASRTAPVVVGVDGGPLPARRRSVA